MAYLLGIDVGTSGTKALVIREDGRTLGSATVDYPLATPRPGWAEQDPADWWRATGAAVRAACQRASLAPEQISAIGLSGQMHGSVFLDEAHQVLRPAILWCDQRTAAQCETITAHVGAENVVRITCNRVLTGFTAPKIVWLKEHEPETYARVRKVLLPKDYLRFRLTGEFATEVSDASGTALFDVPRRQWSGEILDALEIPTSWLPKVYESPEVSGRVSAAAAAETGLKAGTPVVGGGGDQAAGAVGNGIVSPGAVSIALGTSGVVFAYADEPVMDPQLRTHTFCHAVPGKWHVMGVMLSAGGSLRWYRDTLAEPEVAVARRLGVDPYEVITDEAAQAPLGAEGLLFLPYLTGERTPYPDPNARGVFFGLSLRHDHRHLARAVIEGVSFGLRDSFDILRELGVPIGEVRVAGGGARSRLWREILAAMLGMPLSQAAAEEGPALGVALLAGVGIGVYPSVPEACACAVAASQVTPPPDPAQVAAYDRYHALYQALYRQLQGLFADTAAVVREVGA
ncbi:MAG: xylulokinase [Armatimonadetes bacterium]|nr:xylulokinase [Armatimonadota bacterium]